MLADTDEHYRSMEERGIPKHSTHSLITTGVRPFLHVFFPLIILKFWKFLAAISAYKL